MALQRVNFSSPFFLFVAALVFFLLLILGLQHLGIYNPLNLYLGEKTLIVYRGAAIDNNMPIIYPTLPFLITILCYSPIVAQIMSTALCISILSVFLKRANLSPLLFWSCITTLFFSPCFVFLGSVHYCLYLYYFLLTISFYYISRYMSQDDTMSLLLCGLINGFLVLCDLTTLAYGVLIIFALYLHIKKLGYKLFSSWIMSLFLIVIFFLFAVMNCYIYTEQISRLFNNVYLKTSRTLYSEAQIFTAGSNFWYTLWFVIKYLMLASPIFLPFWIGLYCMIRQKKSVGQILIYLFPILFIIVAVSMRWHNFTIQLPALALLFFMVILGNIKLTALLQKVMAGSLCISLCYGFFFHSSPGNPLLVQLKEMYGVLRTSAPIDEQKAIANYILAMKPGRILCNDDVNYGIIYFTQDPARFLLPNEFEFPSAISNPQLFTPYLLWTKNTNDDFLSQWLQYKMPENYKVISDYEHYSIYGLEDN
ncbi:MAG: hypothetical protein JHC93_04675 [Parachlamydiales bacterium]|nr:hypothetical protein [Parachlamydiales bacterium]